MLTARSSAVFGLCLAVVFCALSPAAAQETPSPAGPEFDTAKFTGFSFYAENDLFQKGRMDEDRNYTGGFGFQFNGSFVEKAHLDAPLRVLDGWTLISKKKHEELQRHFFSLMVFGTAFTPDNLRRTRPVRGDRPYGSIIGVSARRLSVDNDTLDTAWSSELVVGALGLPVARNLQTWIHRRLRARSGLKEPYDPLGWHNQISDGGEPTALYRVAYEKLLVGTAQPNVRKHVQLSGGLVGSVGYYTNVNAILNARLGAFNSNFWEFRPDAMNSQNQNLEGGRPKGWELFVFGGVRPRFNIYNALLQGQFRESVYTVGIKRATVEWDLGAAAFIPALRMQISWNVLAGRTSEFEGTQPRTHTWGSIIFTYAPRMGQQ
jgi:hypothetical protein